MNVPFRFVIKVPVGDKGPAFASACAQHLEWRGEVEEHLWEERDHGGIGRLSKDGGLLLSVINNPALKLQLSALARDKKGKMFKVLPKKKN